MAQYNLSPVVVQQQEQMINTKQVIIFYPDRDKKKILQCSEMEGSLRGGLVF